MRAQHIINEAVTKVEGTNCGNCTWRRDADTRPVDKEDLNKQGGLISTNTDDLQRARDSDLVTLPGRDTVKQSFFCKQKNVKQWVTVRMCCIYWDNPGVLREFGKMSIK